MHHQATTEKAPKWLAAPFHLVLHEMKFVVLCCYVVLHWQTNSKNVRVPLSAGSASCLVLFITFLCCVGDDLVACWHHTSVQMLMPCEHER